MIYDFCKFSVVFISHNCSTDSVPLTETSAASFGYFTRKYPVSRIVSGNSPSLQLLADCRKSTARQLMILNRQADPT